MCERVRGCTGVVCVILLNIYNIDTKSSENYFYFLFFMIVCSYTNNS